MEACPTRDPRAEVTVPNAAFVWAPVAVLNVAEVFTPENCVWLNVLYASNRNWPRTLSLNSGKFLKIDMSKLLMPGPRKTSLGAFPAVPTAGTPNAPVLKYWLSDRLSLGRMGFESITGRTPSPPPGMSTPFNAVKLMPVGAPLMKDAIPESC